MATAANWLRQRYALLKWVSSGRPVPIPHLRKRRILLRHAHRFGLTTLVETGTFQGDMVAGTRRHFSRIITIELENSLFGLARARFGPYPHIEVLHGDSGTILQRVLEEIDAPALYWLDAHYSGGVTARGSIDSPVVAELQTILDGGTPSDVVLIDDARLFGDTSTGYSGYPSLGEVQEVVDSHRPTWVFEVQEDIIRLHPREEGAGG